MNLYSFFFQDSAKVSKYLSVGFSGRALVDMVVCKFYIKVDQIAVREHFFAKRGPVKIAGGLNGYVDSMVLQKDKKRLKIVGIKGTFAS